MQQHVHELVAGFDALMIKIGNGLLPAVNSFMSMIVRNLPAIENFGTSIAHLIAPGVTGFFHGLEAVLKELFGPLRTVTEAVGVAIIAFMGMLKLVAVFKAVGEAWTALQVLLEANPWVLVVTAIAAAAVLIIKYHKQIYDFIVTTWHDIEKFFTTIADPIVKPVEKLFDDIQKYVTNGFDKWWKSHGQEIEKLWHDAWTKIEERLQGRLGLHSASGRGRPDADRDVHQGRPGRDHHRLSRSSGPPSRPCSRTPGTSWRPT